MKRKIIKIDEEKCTGCGSCVDACHEGAIGLVNGKARLMREDYCDGLGDCLPSCPEKAITFEEREAPLYDEQAVMKEKMMAQHGPGHMCPGSMAKAIRREKAKAPQSSAEKAESELGQWPVQIKLVPVNAPYFKGANLLIAADCTAYAYGSFHKDFMRNRITIIGCPKLDAVDYSEKLEEIIRTNDIKSVKIIRMEVPCCGGLEMATRNSIKKSGKFIPWSVVTISTDGRILED